MDFEPFLTRTDYLALWNEEDKRPEPFDTAPEGGEYTLSDLLEAHVKGEDRFGVYTPDDDGNSRWACIDIDGMEGHARGLSNADEVLEYVCGCLTGLGLIWYKEQSHSGKGWHVWVFYDRPVPARNIRAALRPICSNPAMWKGELELFPKRDEAPDKVGNLVWLPWWGRSKHCELLDMMGRPTPRREAIRLNKPPAEAGESSRPAPAKEPAKWNPVNWTIDEAASALGALDPDMHYDEWCKVLRGLKYAFGEKGYDLARAWSECAEEKWDEKEFDRVWAEWDRAGDNGTTTHATIIMMAKSEGWVPPSTTRKTRYTVDGDLPREMAVPVDTSDLSCARAILDNLGWPHGALDRLWTYSEERGVWEGLDENTIIEHIERLHNTEVGDKTLRLSKSKITNIRDTIKLTTNWSSDFPEPVVGVAFRNGFLGKDGLTEHSPDHWCRHYIDEDFDPTAVNRQWEDFVAETFSDKPGGGEDDVACLQEFFGSILMGEALVRRKILFLKGDAGTGKSTTLEIFESLFPESAISNVMPQRMTCPENVTQLFDSRVNIIDDLSGQAFKETGMFKSAISGGAIEGRLRYSHPIMFRPRAGWIVAGNRRPDTHDTTDGFFDRWIILSFTRKPKERDLTLKDKILAAGVSGIVAWAWRGYRRLLERGPNSTYSMPTEHNSLVEQWREVSSGLAAWMMDCTTPVPAEDPKYLTGTMDLYKNYKIYMTLFDPHGNILPLRQFVLDLEELGLVRGRHSTTRGFFCGLKAVTADGVKAV